MGKNKISSVQFVDAYFPVVDGVVRVVSNYASSFTSRGNKCLVVAPRTKGYIDTESFEIMRTKSIKIPFFEYIVPLPSRSRKIKKYLKNNKFDIYHFHSPFTIGTFALKMGKKNKVPVIATFHSKYYDDFLSLTKSPRISKYLVNVIVKIYNKADAVWTVNQSSAETLREYGFKKDITVISNGTDYKIPANIKALEEQVAVKYGISEADNVLLFVGQLIWQKNLKLVFDTLKILKEEGFPFKMIVVGIGTNEKAIKKYVGELDLDDAVLFLGEITDKEELHGIYSVSELFFFPSLYDTFSLVVREAAVLKTPSLLSLGANACEGIVDNVDGFIEEACPVHMAQRIKEIFSAREALSEVGEKAACNIPLRWEKVIEKVENLYQEVIENYPKINEQKKKAK